MNTLYFDSKAGDDFRRAELYQGQIFVYSPCPSAIRLCELARELIEEAFGGVDPRKVHESMPIEECAAILAALNRKSRSVLRADRDFFPRP